jgi:hypothetical protein
MLRNHPVEDSNWGKQEVRKLLRTCRGRRERVIFFKIDFKSDAPRKDVGKDNSKSLQSTLTDDTDWLSHNDFSINQVVSEI